MAWTRIGQGQGSSKAAHPSAMPPLGRGRAEGRLGGRPAVEAERPRSPLRAAAAGAAWRPGHGGGKGLRGLGGAVSAPTPPFPFNLFLKKLEKWRFAWRGSSAPSPLVPGSVLGFGVCWVGAAPLLRLRAVGSSQAVF